MVRSKANVLMSVLAQSRRLSLAPLLRKEYLHNTCMSATKPACTCPVCYLCSLSPPPAHITQSVRTGWLQYLHPALLHIRLAGGKGTTFLQGSLDPPLDRRLSGFCRAALDLMGDSPKAYAIKGNLGALLMHAGKVEEALSVLDEGLDAATKLGVASSSLGHISFNKGKVLGVLGRLEEADRVYEETAVACLGHSLNSYSKSLAAMSKIPEDLVPQAAQVSWGYLAMLRLAATCTVVSLVWRCQQGYRRLPGLKMWFCVVSWRDGGSQHWSCAWFEVNSLHFNVSRTCMML